MDISGKMYTPSIGENNYAIGFVDDYTAKSGLYFFKNKNHLFPAIKHFKMRSENETDSKLLNFRLEWAGENNAIHTKHFCFEHAISLKY